MKAKILVPAIASAALTAAAIAGAFVLSAGAAPGAARGSTIPVAELPTHLSAISVGKLAGKTGATQGDYLAYDDALVKPGTKQVVGHISGLCFLVNPSAGSGLYNCWADWA